MSESPPQERFPIDRAATAGAYYPAPDGATAQDGAEQAAAIAVQLRTVAPQDAGPEVIARGLYALQLLAHDVGSELWLELQLRLGSLLLELREGDRATSVAGARAVYRAVLDLDVQENNPSAWEAAVCGYANSLVLDPQAQPDAFDEALGLLEAVVTRLRAGNDVERLGSALSCYARALVSAPRGDRDDLLERALELEREEIRVLGSADRNPGLWGRAQHNLAGFYMQRRKGVRSQNVDSAVKALQDALRVRSPESDPGGRARTLRALALALPEWSGTDSQGEADALAEVFREEAAELARRDRRAAPRPSGWGSLAAETSALNVDLDAYVRLSAEEAVPLLETAIVNHRRALEGIHRETMAAQWAEWQGGLGRLLAHLAHFGRPDAAHEAYTSFTGALDAITPASRPRLVRDLYRAMGDLCHQVGSWECALVGYARALDLSDALFEEAAAPDSRRRELADMRGFALFAAYAAARLGRLADAVRLAERGRSRSLVEALSAAEVATSGGSRERREEVTTASRRVAALEAQLRGLEADDAHAIAGDLRGRLADFLGVDPAAVKLRVTDPGPHKLDASSDYVGIAADLRAAREALRRALAGARAENRDALPEQLQSVDIAGVAAKVGHPIVYVLATVYGGAALFVPPFGAVELLLLNGITSDITGTLLHGDGESPGYVDGAVNGDDDALRATLPGVLEALSSGVVQPLAEWLTTRGYVRAAIIPLGRLGLLPLHAAAADTSVSLGYAPSARALARALAGRRSRPAGNGRALLGIGNPLQSAEPSLPFAVAEVRAAARNAERWTRTTVLVRDEATSAAVGGAAGGSTHLHFACHGLFRPSDPTASALLLAGDDRVTLGALLRGEVDLSSAELAVLSACQTANTDFRSLPDEALGLPSGLLLAGVPGVVATMWPVDDRAAALYCQQLYEELFLNDREPAAAVSAAQRWLRDASAGELAERVTSLRSALTDDDGETDTALSDVWRDLVGSDPDDRPFAAPEYWAAFTYTGV